MNGIPLAITQLPGWAQEEVRLRRETIGTAWETDDPFHDPPERFARIVHIAYPNQVHYVLQKLEGGEWVNTEPTNQQTMYWSQELAVAAAQKRAYHAQVPFRVLEVVWRG